MSEKEMGRREEDNTVSREHMEQMVAHARVETLVHGLSDKFNEHVKDDSEHFDRLYDKDDEILARINEIPDKMRACKDSIQDDILENIKEHYVPKGDFNDFRNKIIYTAFGAMLLASLIEWGVDKVIGWEKINLQDQTTIRRGK